MYCLFFNIIPQPAPRPRVTRRGTYNPTRYTEYKNFISVVGRQNIDKPIVGALEMEIIFNMPIPKSYSNKKKIALMGTHHTKRPDLDNLIKSIKDGLSGVAYKDDSQVSVIVAKKIYSTVPSVEVMIREL